MDNKNSKVEKKFLLASQSHQNNNLDVAEKLYNEILDQDTNHLKTNFFLGSLLLQKKQYQKAKELLSKTISINPNFPDPYNNLGIAVKELGQKSEAITYFKKAIEIEPNNKTAYNNLGIALKELGKYQEAIASYLKAIQIDPNNSNVYNNLGALFTEFGNHKESAEYFEKAIKIQPKYRTAYANLLFNLCWLNDDKKYLDVAKKYYDIIPRYKKNNTYVSSNEKFLKVGFVSGDFRNHPVAYFLLDTLKNLNEKNLKLFAYSNSDIKDDFTKLLKQNFNSWNEIFYKNDQDVIDLIRKDNIDVLIDFSVHSKNNRLVIFKNRCAPIQATWCGWLASTGIEEIDYIIGDPHVTPLSDQPKFVEKIYQLKKIWQSLSTTNLDKKEISLQKGYENSIVFGSFNNPIKLNESVIKIWSKILNKIPKSKIFLKYSSFDIPEIRKKFIENFVSWGVKEEKIIIEGQSSRADYMQSYNKIDIILDSFPVTGGTTSFEASYMGTPILTKISKNNSWFKSGLSINKNLNMEDWIATNEDDYIEKAIKFAENKNYLSALKKRLRDVALKSPLFDTKNYCNDFYEMLLNISKKN